jgi:hypothetical protein
VRERERERERKRERVCVREKKIDTESGGPLPSEEGTT